MAASPAITLQIGHTGIESDSPELDGVIARQNLPARIADLPDNLNPSLIDPARLHALLAALPADTAATLGGKALLLSPALLRIGTSAPTTPASFVQGVTLQPMETHGGSIAARATVAVDCDLARRQAGLARAAFTTAGQDVAQREAAKPSDNAGLVALSDSRARRFAIATVWKENATAAAGCTPGDTAAAGDLEAATKAVAASVVAPRSGMPG